MSERPHRQPVRPQHRLGLCASISPRHQGGLYAWEKVRHCPEVILVEGLFDYATLRQAGFPNVTCSSGTHRLANRLTKILTEIRKLKTT
jgi:hypothetical protein